MVHWYDALAAALENAAREPIGGPVQIATLNLDTVSQIAPDNGAKIEVMITRATRTLVFAEATISATNGARLISAAAVLKAKA